MKLKIFIFSTIILPFLTGCDDGLKEKVKFDVTVESEGSSMIKDTLVVKKSTPVQFNFYGNPNFITFYSGESGHIYQYRERTLLSKDEITSELRFSSFAQYGTIPGTLKVYLSSTFGEMSLDRDKKADSTKIVTHNWIDISDQCNLPTTSSTTLRDAAIPLDDYLGQNLIIAFLYQPLNNTAAQPTWEIQSLRIVNTSKTDGSESTLAAGSMGLTPFDMYAAGTAAYQSGTTSGIWNLSNIAATPPRVRMQSSSIGADINKDWLITKPIVINACTPDMGVGIKTIINRLDNYVYQYNKAGIYTVTMIGRNNNFESSSEIIREILIKVID
jgi:hypothetical protein